MIGYVTLGTNDLDRARAFYDALFETIGARRLRDMESGGAIWGTGWDRPVFEVGPPFNREPATVGNGTMIALAMKSRDQVGAFHARALELGGTDEGAPGVRGEEGPQAFYGAYFRDPDGNKLCAFRIGTA